jgi:hypothetical protein
MVVMSAYHMRTSKPESSRSSDLGLSKILTFVLPRQRLRVND